MRDFRGAAFPDVAVLHPGYLLVPYFTGQPWRASAMISGRYSK